MSFHKNQKVNYSARASSGSGKIVEVKSTAKGAFYVVKDEASNRTISLRAAHLSAA